MLIMAVLGGAIMSVAYRAFAVSTTVTERRDVFADGRSALDQMTKLLRQAESIDPASTTSEVRFSSYVDGQVVDAVYRVTGGEAPYALERSLDGGATYTELVSPVSTNEVFVYTQSGDVTDQVTIDLHLETQTSTVELTTDVFLRNA